MSAKNSTSLGQAHHPISRASYHEFNIYNHNRCCALKIVGDQATRLLAFHRFCILEDLYIWIRNSFTIVILNLKILT